MALADPMGMVGILTFLTGRTSKRHHLPVHLHPGSLCSVGHARARFPATPLAPDN
jgi:hypothetical protein